jgi:hypothetical protein
VIHQIPEDLPGEIPNQSINQIGIYIMASKLQMIWKNLKYLHRFVRIIYRFEGYKPQPVTLARIATWLSQFEDRDKKIILQLLDRVIYISEKNTESILLDLNRLLLDRLEKANITLKKVIYVQIHDPGSSSGVVLNMLRDGARLESKGCYFIDSKNVRELFEITSKLGEGAIIYVDDFAASGDQFSDVRDHLAEYIVGNFAEFFLLPGICEEAYYQLGKRGVEAVAKIVHSKADRPLHPNSSLLDKATKERLIHLCTQIDKKGSLGYKELATMVVFYRNTPTTAPAIIRGCVKQNPWIGILPRTTDLP